MVPSSTKRKRPPSNKTLLDFYPSLDAVKRARVRTSMQSASASQEITLVSREIIVIDSDSDDDIHGKEIDARLFTRTAPQSSNLATFTPAHAGDMDAFGVPSELLQSIHPHSETSSDGFQTPEQFAAIAHETESSGSMFGIATLLQTPLENQLAERSIILSDTTVEHSLEDHPVGFPAEEWPVGDDELINLGVPRNDTENDEGEPATEQRSCPVCGIDLTAILVPEAQTHVNQCLDATLANDNLTTEECTSVRVSIKHNDTGDDDGLNTLAQSEGNDVYSVLMRSHQKNEICAEMDIPSKDIRPTRGNRRTVPFYKVLQGMPIAVDAFCYGTIPGITAYFLTHAHSDHYTNLGPKWKGGPVYCSEETANLIIHMLAVDPKWIHPLPLNDPTTIPNTGGVTVTLIEANHCPGSCLFLFEGRQMVDTGDSALNSPSVSSSRIFRYLHCGDFRASPRHVLHPAVKGRHIDHVYLDTTYLDPKYTFSPQPLVISACEELAKRLVSRGIGNNAIEAWMKSSTPLGGERQQIQQKRILVVIGTYSIGKERIVKAIAQALETKIYCDPRKTAILQCQADKELHALLTTDPAGANVHILPLGTVTTDNLKLYLQKFKGTFSKVIGFRPTGWTYIPATGVDPDLSIQSIISQGQSRNFSYTDLQPSQKSSHDVQIFGVPYSEHSSFFELTCFAMSCDWDRIIPTVNMGSPTSRVKLSKWLKRWEMEKRRRTKSTIIQSRTIDYW